MRIWWFALSTLVTAGAFAAANSKMQAVPFTQVEVEDSFWSPRIRTAVDRTIPHNFAKCRETGRIRNLTIAGGLAEGEFEGIYFNDSDVHKALEGACHALALKPDPTLRKQVDELARIMVAAQQPDGYLNSYFTIAKPEERWTDLRRMHELYCAGHFIEAAVAHHTATGERMLLDAAIRLADHIDKRFGAKQERDVPGHQEIELALVKLAKATGEERYTRLAKFFLDERGHAHGRKLYGEYCQDHKPVREQHEIVGHAVRAMYQYCGMADVAAATGDDTLVGPLRRIWEDVTLRKYYVTGGIGPSAHNEGFTVPYDLPNESAYCESCASIGMVFWNHRMNLLHRDAKYVDVLERTLYNSLLAGIALDGDAFFYTNPLASDGDHHRQPWYGCACCPPNFARFLPTVGGYVYAVDDDAAYVNLFVSSQAEMRVDGRAVMLSQRTRYPWDGDVAISVRPQTAAEFTLKVRVPGWCDGFRASINGETIEKPTIDQGYLILERTWKNGDVVALSLDMPIRRVAAHPRVEADRGRVALRRGPIVYCLEQADNEKPVRRLVLPRTTALTAKHRPDLLGGVTVVQGQALAVEDKPWGSRLYRNAGEVTPASFTAIPYCVWDNREAGPMTVWLPESPALVTHPRMVGAKASASHVSRAGKLDALSDGDEPAHPADATVAHFDWWKKRGTTEWVQYTFDSPRRVSAIELYWFDDHAVGGRCRPPESWKLLYQKDDDWAEVPGVSGYGTESNRLTRITFPAVRTKALRIEAKLQDEFSGGLTEWVVYPVADET